MADEDLLPGEGNFIAILMGAILTSNSFEYEVELYTEQDGCTIGTRAAPTYCGVYMFKLLRKTKLEWLRRNVKEGNTPLMWNTHSQKDLNITQPKKMGLFQDDLIFFWTGTKAKLLEFLHFLNSRDPAIQFN